MTIVSTKNFATVALVFLCASSMCMATVNTTSTTLTKGKMVPTSYMTLQAFSDMNCVRKCFLEKMQNRCSVAGYDKSTQTCFLSNDGPQDLLATADEDVGVFFYSGSEGLFNYQ